MYGVSDGCVDFVDGVVRGVEENGVNEESKDCKEGERKEYEQS